VTSQKKPNVPGRKESDNYKPINCPEKRKSNRSGLLCEWYRQFAHTREGEGLFNLGCGQTKSGSTRLARPESVPSLR